jgi:hypothetical protein
LISAVDSVAAEQATELHHVFAQAPLVLVKAKNYFFVAGRLADGLK